MNVNCNVKKVRTGYDRKTCWVQTRAGIVQDCNKAVMTTQKLRLTGSDIFYGICTMISNDMGETWSEPIPQEAFKARPDRDGTYFYVSDFCPKWHSKSATLLGTGHTPRYKDDELTPYDYKRSTPYSIFDPNTDKWSEWRFLELPDNVLFQFSGSGCSQRLDLPDGDILLPMSSRDISQNTEVFGGLINSFVARCSFDGHFLVYKEHGNFLSVKEPRGLVEPSLEENNGKFYLTLRNDIKGYLAFSDDGLNFSEPIPWRFDNGDEIGNYCTQQHWVKLKNRLFLVYTRRGLDNDHVFRHRAPLVMAEFDEEKLCLIKDSEMIVVPERGARLGNFGVTPVSDSESWVVVSEWMQGIQGGKSIDDVEKCGADNTFFISKLTV